MRERGGAETDMRELCIIHAADLHLDSPFEALGAKAKERREEQRALLSRMRLDKERLRAAYVALRAGGHRDVRAVAEAMRVSLPQAVFALITLSQIGLISVRPAPFSASLLPLRRCDPSESPFYRLAWELKEEDHGIYGL